MKNLLNISPPRSQDEETEYLQCKHNRNLSREVLVMLHAEDEED